MRGCIAVLDLGNTNTKVVAFDETGAILAERGQPNAPLLPDVDCPYLRLDVEGAWTFLLASLKEIGARFPIEAISIAAHGAAGVLVSEAGVALPPMDYEF